MVTSDRTPDSSSGSTDGGQNTNDDGELEPEVLADALADAGAEIGQTGHEMRLRADALHEQCQDVAEALRAGKVSASEVDGLVAEAIEAVGDVEAWSGEVFEVLVQCEEVRASSGE
jgi:hypothetical protein